MPSRLRPSSIPQEAAVAVDMIGNQTRTEVLHLVAAGHRTAAAVSARIAGVGPATVHRHLSALEDAGLVRRTPQKGRLPDLWDIDRAAARALADRWAAYVTDES